MKVGIVVAVEQKEWDFGRSKRVEGSAYVCQSACFKLRGGQKTPSPSLTFSLTLSQRLKMTFIFFLLTFLFYMKSQKEAWVSNIHINGTVLTFLQGKYDLHGSGYLLLAAAYLFVGFA